MLHLADTGWDLLHSLRGEQFPSSQVLCFFYTPYTSGGMGNTQENTLGVNGMYWVQRFRGRTQDKRATGLLSP